MYLIVSILVAAAAAGPTVVISPGADSIELGPRLEYVEDADKQWRFEDVRTERIERPFVAASDKVPNHGFTTSAYWYRVRLASGYSTGQRFFLEMPYVIIDRLEIFVERESGSETYDRFLLGDLVPGGGRVINLPTYVVPINLAPGKPKRLYVRAETEGSLQMPLRLWHPDAFVIHTSNHQLFYGPIYGLLLMLLIYNLFLYFMLRDRSHLHFAICVVGAAFYIAYFTGQAQAYLFANSPWLANTGYPLAMILTHISMYLFTRRFLDLAQRSPRLDRLFVVYVVAGLLIFPLALVASYRVTLMATIAVIVSGVLVAAISGGYSLYKGFKPARYYVAAWSAFFVGIVVFATEKAGLLPASVFTDNGHVLGYLATLVLLPVGLASRISLLQEDKERALRERIDALNKVMLRAEKIATGDLSTRGGGDTDDAILDRMVTGLRGIIERVRAISTRVVGAAEALATQANAQEESARSQATAAEESRRTMDALRAGSQDIADEAAGVASAADRAKGNAELVADRISRLDASVVRITEALGQVRAIANKSEVLALNAALEATRAGEAGRGFSLVAGQMQQLAENTKGLVEDIADLVSEIERSRQDTLVATAKGEDAVSRVGHTASRIGLIAQQQHGGTEEALDAVAEIGQVATDVARASAAALTAASELAGFARELREAVSRFKL